MEKEKWDKRFLSVAKSVSEWSKDPSTKVGAVIANSNYELVSSGFNGFPKKIYDNPEHYANRDIKYKKIIHAEINAILFSGVKKNCILFTYPFMPCSRCASFIIQQNWVEIKKVVAPVTPLRLLERWGDDMEISVDMFKEANIEVVLYDFC